MNKIKRGQLLFFLDLILEINEYANEMANKIKNKTNQQTLVYKQSWDQRMNITSAKNSFVCIVHYSGCLVISLTKDGTPVHPVQYSIIHNS